jgi:DNA-binding response OmpR family regulator
MRADKILVPILSALGTSENIVTGLNAGTDDYMTKPLSLVNSKRIQALHRRAIQQPENIENSRN